MSTVPDAGRQEAAQQSGVGAEWCPRLPSLQEGCPRTPGSEGGQDLGALRSRGRGGSSGPEGQREVPASLPPSGPRRQGMEGNPSEPARCRRTPLGSLTSAPRTGSPPRRPPTSHPAATRRGAVPSLGPICTCVVAPQCEPPANQLSPRPRRLQRCPSNSHLVLAAPPA